MNISNNTEKNQKEKDSLISELTNLEFSTDKDVLNISIGLKKTKDTVALPALLSKLVKIQKK